MAKTVGLKRQANQRPAPANRSIGLFGIRTGEGAALHERVIDRNA